jgi:FKBP-type peptidyl-prolyl cis-trans isomerase
MIALPPLAQGTTFASDYRIVELLSHTNHLALYGAVHVPTGTMRVLELLFSPVVPGAAFRDRFARAALDTCVAASAIVPRVEAAGIDVPSQVPFVAMEPFRGEVLAAAATRSGGMPVADAMDILGQIAAGLGQLHAAGLVHGGLRPESIVLTASPTPRPGVKLMNASLAKVLGDARAALAPSAPPCDPAWASPEQIAGDDATVASDVYAFALLAFAIFTGQRIWRGSADAPIVRESTKEPLPIPTMRAYELGRGGTLPMTFDGWFARAASRAPHERYASVGEAFADLEAAFQRASQAFTGSIGAMTSGHVVVPPTRSSSGKALVFAAVALGGVVAFSALGALAYNGVHRFKERAEAARLAIEQQRIAETKTSGADVAAADTAPAAESADSASAPSIDVAALPTAETRRHHHADTTTAVTGTATGTTATKDARDTSREGAPSSAAALLETKPSPSARLRVVDLVPGKGKVAHSGDAITVRYVGKRQSDGVTYDASHSTTPYAFTLGQGRVTKGWEQGIPGMKVGGKRRLIVPPQLAYGEKGLGSAVPPNATLIFDIELVRVGE